MDSAVSSVAEAVSLQTERGAGKGLHQTALSRELFTDDGIGQSNTL